MKPPITQTAPVSDPAALMTLSEYQAKVTPLFQAYNKFMRKNGQYFKNKEYYGVECYTFPEFIASEMGRLSKDYKSLAEDDSYARSRWFDSSMIREKQRVEDPVPVDVLKQYQDYIQQFKQYFTEDEVARRIDRDEVKSNKRSVRRALENDYYLDALKDGLVTPAKLVEIFNSLNIKMPKRILEMKTKVETEGYDRSKELSQAKKTKEFEDLLRVELGPHYEELRQIEKQRIEKIVENFETAKSEGKDLHDFIHRYDRNHSYQAYISNILNSLFEGKYSETETDKYNRKKYVHVRRAKYDEILEKFCTAFAEQFIVLFIARIELKLRVINTKLGQPKVSIDNVHFQNMEFEGWVHAKYDNGVTIDIEAQVIIAGGYNIQVTHYRYLLKTFYKGKFIDLEDLDALKF